MPPAADPSAVVVRRAVPADRERAIAIVFESLHSFAIEPDPEGLDADLIRFGEGDAGAHEIVATIDGEVCGLSSLIAYGAPVDRFGWISKVFVDARFRRRGAAKRLMLEIVREARARGYERLGLKTRTIFREAIALYESSGWTRGPAPASGPCDRAYFFVLD